MQMRPAASALLVLGGTLLALNLSTSSWRPAGAPPAGWSARDGPAALTTGPVSPARASATRPETSDSAAARVPGTPAPAGGSPQGPRADTAASQPAPLRAIAGARINVREFTPGSKAHADAIASVVGSAEAQQAVAPVARLYFAYFGRVPDYEGLSHYVEERDAGTPLGDIAEEFAGSDEFDLRYGALDHAGFVDLVFRNVAGGAADAAQRAHWIAQLESGAMTRGEVMLAFSEGAGFQVRVGDEVFVTMAYAETLRRTPHPAELARWVGLLEAGHPRRAVIDSLVAASRRR